MVEVTKWLDQIQLTCKQIEHPHIQFIVDQCGLPFTLIPALSSFSPEIQWRSLFEGLPEESLWDEAPLLIQIDLEDEQQIQWMYRLAREVASYSPLLVIGSSWPFQTLAHWLTQCANASFAGGEGVLRYWDTRIFSYVQEQILNVEQDQLLQPALFWSWMDRDGQASLLEGNGEFLEKETCQPIQLSDSQIEAMMCLCDAKDFIEINQLPKELNLTQESLFSATFTAMVAATQKGMILDQERHQWVYAQLTQNQKLQ